MARYPDPYVVTICGSLRDTSRTRIVLHEIIAASAEAGATTELADYAGVTDYPATFQRRVARPTNCETDN